MTYNGRPRPPQVLLEPDGRSRSARRAVGRRARCTARLADVSLPRDRFATRLAARPLLADGGMGTLLFSRGIPQRACLDELATSGRTSWGRSTASTSTPARTSSRR